jgi:hypothetical protein
MAATRTQPANFRVLDVLDGPHGGLILRLRLQSGDPPSIKSLKGARMRATSPDGTGERFFRVEGFAVFGGRPSDERLARTGRVDVHVTPEDSGGNIPIELRWEVSGPLAKK